MKLFYRNPGAGTEIRTFPEFSLNQQLSSIDSASRVVVKLIEVLEEKDFTYLVTAWMPLGDLQSKM